METNDVLPVYRARSTGIHPGEYTDYLKAGDMFLFATNDVDSGEGRVFKLVRTDDELECHDCPLNHYDCNGIGCCIKEVK